MSIYAFSKLVSERETDEIRSTVQHLAEVSRVALSFGSLDQEDEKVLEQSTWLHGAGLVFSVSTPGGSDIGTLWAEANSAALQAAHELTGEAKGFGNWTQVVDYALPEEVRRAVVRTRLGQFVVALFAIKNSTGAGFAIFDNAVDQIIEETPENCLLLILKTFLLPWDNGPNALFVWQPRTPHGPGN
jgi:hypothetical protein